MPTIHHPRDRHKFRYWVATNAYESQDFRVAAALFRGLQGDDLRGEVSRYYAADSLLRLGLRQLAGGQTRQAVATLEDAHDLSPHHGTLPEFLRAATQRISGCVTPAPEASETIGTALAAWRIGRTGEAIAILRHAHDEAPHDLDIQYRLAVLLAADEAFDEAARLCHDALQRHPNDARLHLQVALCHGACREPARAVPHLLHAQRLRPNDAQVALWLALALDACPDRKSPSLPTQPPLPPRVLHVADIEALGNLLLGEPDIAEAFTAMPGHAGDDVFELLLHAVERAITLEPRRGELHYYRGCLYQRMAESTRAVASFERAVALQPGDTRALIAVSKCYYAAGRLRDAEHRLREVIAHGCEYADVHYLLGCVHRDLGHAAEARRAFTSALAINDTYDDARRALAGLAA